MDYQIAPVAGNEEERLAALRAAMCAYIPHEERFDRITRMARRMLHVPIALISILEDDTAWFRSAQGLSVSEMTRNNSFYDHAIGSAEVFQVRDTLLDGRFTDNPLVTGPPHIRSYFGWPLEIAPGLRVGTLCVMDTMPRTFSSEDLETMADLAHMVESELRVNAMSDNQKSLLAESSRAHRKKLLDPATGCWSEEGFVELMKRTLKDVASGTVHAALVGMEVHNMNDFDLGIEKGSTEARAMVLVQFIRRRMPANAILCRMPGGRACALFAARERSLLREQIGQFLQEPDFEPVAGIAFPQKLEMSSYSMSLKAEYVKSDVGRLLDTAMGKLAEGHGVTSILQ